MDKTNISERKKGVVCYRGKLVELRPVHPEHDLEDIYCWVNDLEVNRYTNALPPLSIGQETEFVNNLGKSKTDVVFAIQTIEQKEFIGLMGIHRISFIDRVGTTGAMIGKDRFRGKGYGADAKMLLLHHGFHRLNLHKINSSTIAFNGRSQAYLKKTGYKQEGVIRCVHYRDGKYWDQVLFGILREEFEPLWEKYISEADGANLII